MLRLFRKRNKQLLIGVDISSTAVKILELSKKNGCYRVESYGLSPLSEGAIVEKNILDPEAVAIALTEAVDMANPGTLQGAIAIPSAMVIHKVISMDDRLDDDEREAQIRIDAEQYIPFPLDQVSLDFSIVKELTPDPAQVQVLLAATRTEHIDARLEVLELAGLRSKVADVESFALERTYRMLAEFMPANISTVGILDIGHNTTTLTVLQYGKIIYSREHLFGGRQLTQEVQNRYGLSFVEAGRAKKDQTLPKDYDAEVLRPFLEAVIQQAARSLQFFFSSAGAHSLDHLLLAGGNANIVGLAQLLQQKLGYPVTIANPFLNMSFATQIDLKKLKNDAPSLMVACGLALRSFAA